MRVRWHWCIREDQWQPKRQKSLKLSPSSTPYWRWEHGMKELKILRSRYSHWRGIKKCASNSCYQLQFKGIVHHGYSKLSSKNLMLSWWWHQIFCEIIPSNMLSFLREREMNHSLDKFSTLEWKHHFLINNTMTWAETYTGCFWYIFLYVDAIKVNLTILYSMFPQKVSL